MKHRISKTAKILLPPTTLFITRTAYAAINCDINAGADPNPLAILCPVVRLLNAFVWVAGVVFVTMVFITVYKFAMAQGDPKAIQGAKNSLNYAIIGFIVVIGLFSTAIIISGLFGVNISPMGPAGSIHQALHDFLFNPVSVGPIDLPPLVQ